MIVFTIIFGNLASIHSEGVPYPIFVFLGLTFWQFFSAALNSSANSLISNENIIKKIYFPRIMAPISSTFAHIVDLIPTLAILAGLLFYYKIMPSFIVIVFLPALLLMALILSLGIGMLLAPINAKFRDVRYILPFFIQLAFFTTPVIYPSTMFGGNSSLIKIINPIAEIIEVSRSLFFSTTAVDWKVFILSFAFSIILFLAGFYYFRSQENKFVDIL
jgi:lipopolysaccharide transport system permease protein